jgi:heme-degrading monooxygenase HmoA
MAFVVMNSVRASKEDLPAIVSDVQRLGLEGLSSQRGFRSARLMVAEDETEAAFIVEWDSREDFVAYRQTDIGRAAVKEALRLHPHIAFYVVVTALDSPGR